MESYRVLSLIFTNKTSISVFTTCNPMHGVCSYEDVAAKYACTEDDFIVPLHA